MPLVRTIELGHLTEHMVLLQGHVQTSRLYEATFKEAYMLSGSSYRGLPSRYSMLEETEQQRKDVSGAKFDVRIDKIQVIKLCIWCII